MTNLNSHHSLLRIVRWVRNRLWLANVIKGVSISIWLSAALLMGMGLIHLNVWLIDLQIAAALALVPPLVAVTYSLLMQRPSMYLASVTADHWVDANSLLASAWDLSDCQPKLQTAASPLVIRQAQEETSVWWRRLHSLPRIGLPRSSAIAVAISLAGFILLLLPGHSDTVFRATIAEQDAATIASTQNPLADVIESLSTSGPDSAMNGTATRYQAGSISKETRRPSKNSRNPADDGQRDDLMVSASTPEQHTPPSSSVKDGIDTNPGERRLGLSTTAVGNKEQRDGKDGAGGTKDIVREPKRIEASPTLPTKPVAITRVPSDDDSSNDASTAGVELAEFNPVRIKTSEHESLPVAVPAQNVPHMISFDPVERRIISDYFQRLKPRPIQ